MPNRINTTRRSERMGIQTRPNGSAGGRKSIRESAVHKPVPGKGGNGGNNGKGGKK